MKEQLNNKEIEANRLLQINGFDKNGNKRSYKKQQNKIKAYKAKLSNKNKQLI